MIYTKMLKAQGMSYSMILSCLRYQHHSLCADNIRPNKLKMYLQMHFISNFSNRKKGYQHSVSINRAKKIDEKQNYEDMMKFLRVSAKEEEERQKSNTDELKVRISYEVRLTGIPAVIRALKPSLYMDKYSSYSGVLHYPTPVEWYCELEQPLKTSKAYNSLCFKLQVPYNIVTGFCGRQALLNLCALTKQGNSVYSMHKNKQAVDEIFDVVTQQVHMLTTEDLMKLVLFRYNLKDFSRKCYIKVFTNFMTVMNENNAYSVDKLLDFLRLLRQVDKTNFSDNANRDFETVTRKIWNYISNRPGSICMSMLVELYATAPTHHNMIFQVLNQLLTDNITHMSVCDVFMILKEIHKRVDSQQEVTLVNKWLERNFSALTVTDIKALLAKFIDSQYVNPLLLRILPLLIASESVMAELDTELVVKMLWYCMLGQHYNKTVLQTACNQYIEETQGYSSEQLNCLLKAIGTFNFVPFRQQAFFSKVEVHLMENFYNIDVLTLLETFVHLIYINKVAVNFQPYIFAPLFLGIVNEMPDEERIRGAKYLRIIESAFTARNFKPQLTLPADHKIGQVTSDKDPYEFIEPVFAKLLGGESQFQVKPTPTWSGHYLEVQYSVLAEKLLRESFRNNDKFAFLVTTEDSYSKNEKNHMLGHEVANIRLLQEQGINVYLAHSNGLVELKENKLEGFVKSLFLQILDTAQEHVPDSEEEDAVNGDRGTTDDSEAEIFEEEKEDLDDV